MSVGRCHCFHKFLGLKKANLFLANRKECSWIRHMDVETRHVRWKATRAQKTPNGNVFMSDSAEATIFVKPERTFWPIAANQLPWVAVYGMLAVCWLEAKSATSSLSLERENSGYFLKPYRLFGAYNVIILINPVGDFVFRVLLQGKSFTSF